MPLLNKLCFYYSPVCLLLLCDRRPDQNAELHEDSRWSAIRSFRWLDNAVRLSLQPSTPATLLDIPAADLVHAARQSLLLTAPMTCPAASASPMAWPATFTGEGEDCSGFILQVSLYFEMQSHQFTNDRARVAFIISLLSGRALQWAQSIWKAKASITTSLSAFFAHFKEVLASELSVLGCSLQRVLHHLRALSGLCHWPTWNPDGPEEGGSDPELASTSYRQGTTTFPRICKFLPKVYPQLQPAQFTSHILTQGPAQVSVLELTCPWSLPSTPRSLPDRSDPGSSQPRSPIHRRGGRLFHRGRSGPFAAAGWSNTTPSMCLLFEEAVPGGAELRYWKTWAPSHQASSRGMETLAGGGQPPFRGHHRSSKSRISARCEEAESTPSPVDAILHQIWFHGLISTWRQELHGWCPVMPSSTWAW